MDGTTDQNDGLLNGVFGTIESARLWCLGDGCTANAWLQVAVPQGSRIEIDVVGWTQLGLANRTVRFDGEVEPVAYFGLGDASEFDVLWVYLPDGGSMKLSGTVQARRRITVH